MWCCTPLLQRATELGQGGVAQPSIIPNSLGKPLQPLNPLTYHAISQVYDALEIFAGAASLSRCLGVAGYRVGALELKFWDSFPEDLPKSIRNPMDLCTPAGMAFLGCNIYCSFARSCYVLIQVGFFGAYIGLGGLQGYLRSLKTKNSKGRRTACINISSIYYLSV